MTVAELIEQLTKLQIKHGNVEVKLCVSPDLGNDMADVTDVDVQSFRGKVEFIRIDGEV